MRHLQLAELPKLLTLGNPILREVSSPVSDFTGRPFAKEAESLHNVLLRFREDYGFGRGIAAPQLGVLKRILAINLNGQQTTMMNPQVIWTSPEEFSLWDDCMCFPDILVRVRRKSSITVEFQDENGKTCCWEKLDPATSELLQHEIDHLNGILAIDRAIDKESISYRTNIV